MPLVSDTQVVVDGSEQGTVLPPTPWYLGPSTAACLLLALTVLMTVRDMRRRRVTRWFDTVVFAVYGLVGCVLFFLMFCSVREATFPNYNALWVNPLMLFPAIGVWFGGLRRVLRVYHLANLVVVLLTMLVWVWLPQQANAAFFALMPVTALRSINFFVNN